MAKKSKVVYAPGELGRVRDKLGVVDQEEAKRLAEKLGGEIGYERTDEEEQARHTVRHTRHERVDVKIGDRPGSSIPKNRVELPPEAEYGREGAAKKKPFRRKEMDPADDPSVPLKVSYWDRIKMDKFAGQPEFDIKSPGQVLVSMVSLFSEVPDYVSPAFITHRMAEYYKKIETFVVATRNMFPRNNLRRNERIKKGAPLVFAILDVIRYWNIEKISGDLARIQASPRSAKVSDFADILRGIYRPLFILNSLDPDIHIRGAYKILYKFLYIENPAEAKSKYQEFIRIALASFFETRRDVHYLLYPLLMKSVSAKFVPYERFFTERKYRIMSFLNVTEDDQINPSTMAMQADVKSGEESGAGQENGGEQKEEAKEEEISEEEKARRAAVESEKKALAKGLQALEVLFPKAGWDRLSAYPDFYPYFVDMFDLKKGIVNIAPTDPMQQILILMRILEELFFGLRYVSFGVIEDPGGGSLERLDTLVGDIVNSWRQDFETSFEKEYLPRMTEYIRILEGSPEERISAYTKKVITELHWLKRLYYLPYYKFESLVPPPFQKGDFSPIYVKIKKLRKYLAAVAAGIEQGNRAGGAGKHALCAGIDNPWEPYVFQVPNPLSTRLDTLLAPGARNNAALIYFCLAIITVLDYFVNNEGSWAYGSRPGPLFRSVNGEGVMPLTGVDNRIDADGLFKQAVKQRQRKNAGA